jgi:hypothetical protein
MTGKEYMLQYWQAKVIVRRLESQQASIRDLLGNVTVDPSSEHVQTSRDPDHIGKLVAKLADIQDKLNEEKLRAVNLMDEIYGVVNKLGDPDEQLILQMRYIKMLPWSKVEKELEKVQRYYCLDWMMRKHRHALKEIERLTNCLSNSKNECDIV